MTRDSRQHHRHISMPPDPFFGGDISQPIGLTAILVGYISSGINKVGGVRESRAHCKLRKKNNVSPREVGFTW